jgi:hypothetical protein
MSDERNCDGCDGCCKTLAIRELGTRSFTPCRHLLPATAPRVGCGVYPQRPVSCRLWHCQWRLNVWWHEELQPERCGVVFETLPEIVKVNGQDTPVIEAYVIPGRDEEAFNHNAHLRRAIIDICRQGYAILWRMQRDFASATGAERVRIIMADADGAIAVGPTADTVEPKAADGGYREYSSAEKRIIRSNLAAALAQGKEVPQ